MNTTRGAAGPPPLLERRGSSLASGGWWCRVTSRVWSSSWSSLETSILATQRKLGRLIIDETPGLRPCTGCWTHQNTPRPLRGPLQRTCGPRTARGAALETRESRGAAGAQKNVCRCQSSPSPLRGALQSDCANGAKQLCGRGSRGGISA